MEHFFLEFKWTPTLRRTQESNYWGGADVDHTQTIGRDTVKLLGRYISPSPPGFDTPAPPSMFQSFFDKTYIQRVSTSDQI